MLVCEYSYFYAIYFLIICHFSVGDQRELVSWQLTRFKLICFITYVYFFCSGQKVLMSLAMLPLLAGREYLADISDPHVKHFRTST